MHSIKRIILTVFTPVLLLLACVGCQKSESQTAANEKVTLNEVAHSIFYAPMYTAIENGYFADHGIDLDLVTGYGADKTMTALLSGEADIALWGRKPRSTRIWSRPTIR